MIIDQSFSERQFIVTVQGERSGDCVCCLLSVQEETNLRKAEWSGERKVLYTVLSARPRLRQPERLWGRNAALLSLPQLSVLRSRVPCVTLNFDLTIVGCLVTIDKFPSGCP